jgi:hypothetical protein
MRQLKCALGEVPCDPVGRRLKSKLYEISQNSMVKNGILWEKLIAFLVIPFGYRIY